MHPLRPSGGRGRRRLASAAAVAVVNVALVTGPASALIPDAQSGASPATQGITPSDIGAAPTNQADEYEPVFVATEVGKEPDLPETVAFTTSSGSVEERHVTWNLEGYTFRAPFTNYDVQGVTEDGTVVDGSVYSTLEDTIYFVDSGSDSDQNLSPIWDAVKASSGEALLQQKSDQEYGEGESWGYVREDNNSPQLCGAAADSVEFDLYARIWCAERDGFSYKLTFPEAGKYTIVAGTVEMWANQNREMQFEYEDSNGSRQPVGDKFKLGDEGNRHVKSGVIDVSGDSGELVLQQGQGGATPQIAWFTVAKGEQEVVEAAVPAAPLIVPGTMTTAKSSVDTEIRSLDGTDVNSTIIYTTDGSKPGPSNGDVYDGEFLVDRPSGQDKVTVKALALHDGLASSTAEVVYTFVDHEVGSQAYDAVPVGEPWYDTDGSLIQAHGGGFIREGDWYYWVGENKEHNHANFWAVSLYRSKDLLNWEFVNNVLTEESDTGAGRLSTMNMKVERPKLVYNEKTKKYVLWGHWEDKDSYGPSRLVVAVSDEIDGLYEYVSDFRPGEGEVWDLEQEEEIRKTVDDGTYGTIEEAEAAYAEEHSKNGYQSRDFTVYVDPDDSSKAYLVSAEAHEQLRVYPLTDDFQQANWEASYPLFENDSREAAAVVKVDGLYYMFTSGQSGWYPNQLKYAYTDDLSSPDGWSELINIGNNTSFKSQPTWIMDIQAVDGTHDYVYMGDRWNPDSLGQSTYVWLPLDFSKGRDEVQLEYNPDWKLDAESGKIIAPEQRLISERKPAHGGIEGTAVRYVSSAEEYEALPEISDDGYRREWYVIDPDVVENPASAANDGRVENLGPWDSTQYYKPYPGDSGEMPWSWVVDLEKAEPLERVDISWRSHNGSETYSAYSIYGSLDGEDWTLLADQQDNKTVGFTSDALSGTYRWVAVQVSEVINDHNGNSADWAAGLVEVQIYGGESVDVSGLVNAIAEASLGDTSKSSRDSIDTANALLATAIDAAQELVDAAATEPASVTVEDIAAEIQALTAGIETARQALTPAVESIKIELTRTEYVEGDLFEEGTVTVLATLSDGKSRKLGPEEYKLVVPDLSTAGPVDATVAVRSGLIAPATNSLEETFTVQVVPEEDPDGSEPGEDGGSNTTEDPDSPEGPRGPGDDQPGDKKPPLDISTGGNGDSETDSEGSGSLPRTGPSGLGYLVAGAALALAMGGALVLVRGLRIES